MKRTALVCAVVLMAMMCAAQTTPSNPHAGGDDLHAGMQGDPSMGVRASRAEFGKGCGIEDTSTESALEFRRSEEGVWSAAGTAGVMGSAVARVWHDSNWMVDMHSALGPGMATMHTGQMCFDSQGHITYMIDNYVEMADCGCMRFTSLTFATDGRVTRREQRFVKIATGTEIEVPEAAKRFPDVWDFRTLQQLPFYSLVKQ